MSNPVFKDKLLTDSYALTERPMTVSGTLNKLLLMSFIMLVSAAAVYYQFSLGRYDFVHILMITGAVVGLITGAIIIFAKKTAPYLTPIYAFAEGAFISAMSCFFEKLFSGIVLQAVSLTILTVFVMAMLYKMKLITATEKFKSVVLTATIAIAVFYLISFILYFFKIYVPYFDISSPLYSSPLFIGINILVVGLAALNLIIDFDFIEKGQRYSLPAIFEWYGAFGLMVTIVWLYIEILRLLSRFRNN